MSEAVADWDVETVCTLIGNARRQRVLKFLDESGGDVRTAELVNALAPRCEGSTEQVRMALKHVDLPKLDGAGVIRYDAGDDRVDPTVHVETLCATVDAIEETVAARMKRP